MDNNPSTRRSYAAGNRLDASERTTQDEKMPIRVVAELHVRARNELQSALATIDIPLVSEVEREAQEDHAAPVLLRSSARREAEPRYERAEPRPVSEEFTIEIKRPAALDSAKHRFDELKINFLTRYPSPAVKSILFLGTSRGDGASTAAFNFAQSLAQDTDTRVLLISADLRGPASNHGRIDAGLSSLAESGAHAPAPALQGNVHVLPSGRGYADPAVLFQSKRFQTFMAQVSSQFDYIVLDGPPLNEAPESIALCSRVDGVILVIDAQRTRRKIALRAKQRVQEIGGKLLGVVLNRRKYYVPGWLYKLM